MTAAADEQHRRQAAAQRTLFACLATFAFLFVLISLGHDGRKVWQLAVLALPAIALMAWPIQSHLGRALRTLAVWAWAMSFAVDAVMRGYLLNTYGAAADSSMVIGAAANTSSREIGEYLALHWRAVTVWVALLFIAAVVFGRYAPRGAQEANGWPRWAVVFIALSVLVSAVGFASKPWRRLHPVLFWTEWDRTVDQLRATWLSQEKVREQTLKRARAAGPIVTQPGPATVVLVITDSLNRDNMSLYGYGRATSPQLTAAKKDLPDQLLVMRNAWSVDASTLPSINNIMRFGAPAEASSNHILAMARAAGYKVWWMSNHDDIGIEQQHAKYADVVEMVNRTPGRSGYSLDGELLDCLQEALEDPTERKLIVLHFLGAHPHYNLRFPPDANPFDDQTDAVETALEEHGRSSWIRRFRQEYDSAVLYSDLVAAKTLQLTRTVGSQPGYRAWMFLSDHGQEVGHSANKVGHSPQTASGYRVPTLIWRSRSVAQERTGSIEKRPFRTDWASWTIADVMHLSWTGSANTRNAIRPNYQWVEPQLPVAVESFYD